MNWLKRTLLHWILKKCWNVPTKYDIIFSEHEKRAILNEAKAFDVSLYKEYLFKKIMKDVNDKFYLARTDYDLIFPQAVRYTISMIHDITVETAHEQKRPQGQNYRAKR